jgi:hypothetical protein
MKLKGQGPIEPYNAPGIICSVYMGGVIQKPTKAHDFNGFSESVWVDDYFSTTASPILILKIVKIALNP